VAVVAFHLLPQLLATLMPPVAHPEGQAVKNKAE